MEAKYIINDSIHEDSLLRIFDLSHKKKVNFIIKFLIKLMI